MSGRDRQVRGAGSSTAAITEARPSAGATEERRNTQPARHSIEIPEGVSIRCRICGVDVMDPTHKPATCEAVAAAVCKENDRV